MTSANDPWLSSFERQELLGVSEPWTVIETSDGVRAVYKGRSEMRPAWVLTVVFDIEDSGLPVTEMSLSPAALWPPPDGLTTEVLRGITFETMRSQLRDFIRLPDEAKEELRLDVENVSGGTRPGRRGQEDWFYVRWAGRYVGELRNGPNPVARMADKNNSPAAIRGYLHEARSRGLLTEAPSGKAGGELTAKARWVMAENADKFGEDG